MIYFDNAATTIQRDCTEHPPKKRHLSRQIFCIENYGSQYFQGICSIDIFIRVKGRIF